MSLNKVLYSRAIYSVLDLLGDVGGLYSILLDIGGYVIAIVTFLFGSSMEKFLSSGIFNKHSQHHTSSKRLPKHIDTPNYVEAYEKKKPFSFCFRDSKK